MQIEVGANSDLSAASWRDTPISVLGLRPKESVAIESRLETPQGEWRAERRFLADPSGVIDVLQDDGGWPWWSVTPPELAADPKNDRLTDYVFAGGALTPTVGERDPLRYVIRASRAEGTAVERQFIRNRIVTDVVETKVREGKLRGAYFAPESRDPVGAALVLGGSEGGIAAGRAAALAGEGFAVFAQAYFDYADLSGRAVRIPLEVFRDGLDWLSSTSGVAKCSIWGGSRGSEAALMTAATWPERVCAVIGWVPTHLLHGGFDMAGGEDFSISSWAMWTLGGESLPFIDLKPPTASVSEARRLAYMGPPGYLYANEYLSVWDHTPIDHPAAIPIEHIQSPVLLVSADEDGIWPSKYGAERLIERARRADPTREAIHVTLEGAGHAIGMPHEPRPWSNIAFWNEGYAGINGGFVDMGGAPGVNAAAARRGWATALSFLQAHS